MTATQPGEETDQDDPEADHLKGEPQVVFAPDVRRSGQETDRTEEDEEEAGQHAENRDPGAHRAEGIDLEEAGVTPPFDPAPQGHQRHEEEMVDREVAGADRQALRRTDGAPDVAARHPPAKELVAAVDDHDRVVSRGRARGKRIADTPCFRPGRLAVADLSPKGAAMAADGLQPDKTFIVTMKTWFDQTDGLGILHHSHYVLLMERAQKTMFVALMGKDTLDPTVAPDVYVVVRDIDLHYLAPIRPECDVKLILSVRKVRAAGLTVDFEFRSADLSVLHAKASRTVCRMDGATHQPAAWSEEFRAKHEALVR
jgi:acyl-CoA thioester hydrolase